MSNVVSRGGIRWLDLGCCKLPIIESSNVDPIYNIKPQSEFGKGYESPDRTKYPVGYSVSAPRFPDHLRRSRQEVLDRAKEDVARQKGLFFEKFRQRKQGIIEVLNQGRTNYCWMNALVNGIHSMRMGAGLRHLTFSSASGAAPMTGFRNVGGWPTKAADWVAVEGLALASDWPPNAIDRKYMEAVKTYRQKFNLIKFYEYGRDHEAMASALSRYMSCPVGYMWWTHAVEGLQNVVIGESELGTIIDNSHGKGFGVDGFAVLSEKMSVPDGGVTIDETSFASAA